MLYLQKITDYQKTVNSIRTELENYIVKNNIKSLVLGISGGIDSAVVAALAKPICDKLNIPLIGRSIIIDSNKQDEINRADAIGHHFCTNFYERDFTFYFNHLEDFNTEDEGDLNIDWEDDIADKIRLGNIKARIRMIYLYHLASETKGLVLSTDNFTEWLLGFSTIMGDWGDYGMIQNLWKTEVYDIAKYIGEKEGSIEAAQALVDCIDATATDGLGITNSDLDQILPDWVGNSREGYKEVDNILKRYLNNEKVDLNNPVIKRHNNTHFKRNWPINIKRNELF